MKKRHLKRYVITVIYIFVLGLMATSITLLSKNLLEKKVEEDNYHNYSMSVFEETQIPVEEQPDDTISIPYQGENIEVSKDYYEKDAEETSQQNSLIYYGNTYMPNTGILYESKDIFNVIAISDGTVKDIKEDEILGNVLTIEHNNRLTSIYYTLGDINVKIGDKVIKNQIIATSGTSKLDTKEQNTLLIETYLDAKLVNPNNIFSKKISEL